MAMLCRCTACWSQLRGSQHPCSWPQMAVSHGESGSPGPWPPKESPHGCWGRTHVSNEECSPGVKWHGAGSEILIVVCKVGLVLLVQLPTSLFHALCHPGRATAEHPDLLHLGKEGAKGVEPSSTSSPPSPAPPWPLALQQLWAQTPAEQSVPA